MSDGGNRTSQLSPRYWICPRASCGHRNEWRGTSRKCQGCGGMTRRKKRVPKHAVSLRDISYREWEQTSYAIHGRAVELGACGVCGRHPSEGRPRHDRDHDHKTGNVRGLACWYCNRELLRHATLEQARQVVAYLERVEAYYSELDR